MNVKDLFNEYYLPKQFDTIYFTKRFYQQIAAIKESKQKSKLCSFPGCREKSIVNSHSIQKEGPLRLVAENGKLISPQGNLKSGKIKFKEIGIQKASVFPGFCKKHDDFFEIFENKTHDTQTIIIYQNFRALCREIVNRRILDKVFRKEKQIYYDDQIIAQTRILSLYKNKDLYLDQYSDYIMDGFDSLINDNGHFIELLEMFFKEYEHYIKQGDTSLYNIHVETDVVIPVSLSGFSNINFTYSNTEIKFPVLCSILPSTSCTEIFFTTLLQFKELLEYYVNEKVTNNLSILSLVESWMIYGSDNWYLNPSIYKQLSPELVEKMENDFINFSETPFTELPYSIFNNIRKKQIEDTKEYIKTVQDKTLYILSINHEEEKLNYMKEVRPTKVST